MIKTPAVRTYFFLCFRMTKADINIRKHTEGTAAEMIIISMLVFLSVNEKQGAAIHVSSLLVYIS